MSTPDPKSIARALLGSSILPQVPNALRPPTIPMPQQVGSMRTFGPDPNQPASWVIREKGTGRVITEISNPELVNRLNTEKYEAIPIQIYLGSLGQKT